MAKRYKRYYPIFLDIEGREAVVVGGGAVAERKVEGLLNAGAKVTVVSPELTALLGRLAFTSAVRWLSRAYATGDLDSGWLAIAATDDPAVNSTVARDARERSILVNVADDPASCDFIAPSIVEREGLTIAVSTGGRSPAMARRVREEMERLFPDEYGALLGVAAQVRKTLRAEGFPAPADLWRRALSEEVMALVRQGKTHEARDRLLRALKSEPAAA